MTRERAMKMQRNRLFNCAIIGLFLFGLTWIGFPAAGQGPGGIATPPPPVTVKVEPEENGYVVYAPISKGTADNSGTDDGAQLSLKLLVTNVGGGALQLLKTTVKFDGPPFAAPASFDTSVQIAPGTTANVHLQDNLALPNIVFNFKLSNPPPPHVFIELKFAGYSAPVVLVRPLAPHRNAAPQGSYLFPAKASDLQPGEFWVGSSSGISSHHDNDERTAYDMSMHRWNSTTSKWTGKKFDFFSPTKEKDGTKKEDFLIWGEPLYAVADGVIEAVTNDNPDHEPNEPSQGANQVQLRVGNEIVQYLHLKQGSIVVNQGDVVVAGQLLGLVGNSGQSSAPHLHIDVIRKPVGQSGHLRPLLFRNIHLIERAELDPLDVGNGPWVSVSGKSLMGSTI